MYQRLYTTPSKSFFLFGPRGVGKSTYVKARGGYQISFDLLRHATFLDFQRDPSLLEAKTGHLHPGDTVFIDEIQKLPQLLDEVHRLMEDRRLEFILTGSSARKLKRSGANLLAGRAHTYCMFPLTLRELGEQVDLETIMQASSLPVALRAPKVADETLASYVNTYLKEEIKEEALVRRIDQFARFLALAGHLNGNVLNYDSLARDAGKSSKTIQAWYQILEETLLGTVIPPYRPGFKVREAAHPKFYWFDPAVARVASGLAWRDVDSFWKGFAFETVILREVMAFLEISRQRLPIFYYATPGAGEIDFVVETRPKTINRPQELVTIEVKASTSWKREWETPSRQLKALNPTCLKRMIAVYLGSERLTFGDFEIFPVSDFVTALFEGRIF
jgi:predicted AAA+ superfamily ATPase